MDSTTPETPSSSAPAPAASIPPTPATITPTPIVPALPIRPQRGDYLDGIQAANLRRAQSGANWLYWIAGMSLVNTAMIYFKGGNSFAIGLFFMQAIDYGAHERGRISINVGLGLDAMILGAFVVLGLLASRQKIWAFIVGISLMVLDTLFLIYVTGFNAPMTIGIHVWAIVMMWIGMNSLRVFLRTAASRAADSGPAPSSPSPY